MSTKTFLIFFLLIGTYSIHSQYYSLITEGKVFYNYYYFESSLNEEVIILGDSIINDTIYKKISLVYDEEQGFGTPIGDIISNDGDILIREDNISKSVYRRINGYEELYYDFSMEIGDTIRIQFHQNSEYYNRTWQLDSIRSLSNNLITKYNIIGDRKVYYLSEKYEKDDDILWIEGIGNTRGLWGNDGQILMPELICVDSLGTKLFSNSEIQQDIECKGPILLTINNTEFETFNIYPNPTNGKLFIKSIGADRIKSINLYNMKGQLIINRKCANIFSCEININQLDTGFYILEIENERNKLRRMKIMKND
jgi:hypothetical protein